MPVICLVKNCALIKRSCYNVQKQIKNINKKNIKDNITGRHTIYKIKNTNKPQKNQNNNVTTKCHE